MHSLIHEHLAQASARHGSGRAEREQPPPGRVRVRAARLLANLAGRLDSEVGLPPGTQVGNVDL
jgi:hypothetical protein